MTGYVSYRKNCRQRSPSYGKRYAFHRCGANRVILRNGSQPSIKGPDAWFTGTVPHRSPVSGPYAGTCLKRLRHLSSREPVRLGIPSSGAALIITAGVGRVQVQGWADSGGPPGDTVWFPPYVKHWHGAAPGVAMTHISVAEEEGGNNVEWLEKVTEEQYTGN